MYVRKFIFLHKIIKNNSIFLYIVILTYRKSTLRGVSKKICNILLTNKNQFVILNEQLGTEICQIKK